MLEFDIKISNIYKELNNLKNINYEKVQKEIQNTYNEITQYLISIQLEKETIDTINKLQNYKIQLLEISDRLMFTHDQEMLNILNKINVVTG